MNRIVPAACAALLLTASLAAQSPAPKAEPRARAFIVEDGKVMRFDGTAPDGFAFQFGRRGYLGVHLLELTPELREHFRVGDHGVMVASVVPDSPAAKAGLKAGDIITSVDGEGVDSTRDLGQAVREKKDGEQVKLEFNRDGARQQAFVGVEVRERQEVDLLAPRALEPRMKQYDESMRKLESYFNSPEWKGRVTAMSDCSQMQVKLQELERKLNELEKKLK